MPRWYDERRLDDLVKFVNAPSESSTKHARKRRRKIERRWRQWTTRLFMHEYRSYVRTIRRRWRRCLTRLLIDEYCEYVRAIPWSRLARRLLLDGRYYQLSIFHSVRTKWRTFTAGYLFAARLGEWRWDVRERYTAYRQRTPGAPTSRYWKQQLHETYVAIEEVFRCPRTRPGCALPDVPVPVPVPICRDRDRDVGPEKGPGPGPAVPVPVPIAGTGTGGPGKAGNRDRDPYFASLPTSSSTQSCTQDMGDPGSILGGYMRH